LGRDRARAVVLVKKGTAARQLAQFAAQGAKAVRLNYVHGGILDWPAAMAMAPVLADHDMHIQMLLNTDAHMTDIAADIRSLPVPVVIDHMGWPDLSKGTADPGFQSLLSLVADGHAYVKLSALYRFANPPFDDALPFVSALVGANPARCLWGSDWPHLMLGSAEMPDTGALLNCFVAQVTRAEMTQILVTNPEDLYGFDPANRLGA